MVGVVARREISAAAGHRTLFKSYLITTDWITQGV